MHDKDACGLNNKKNPKIVIDDETQVKTINTSETNEGGLENQKGLKWKKTNLQSKLWSNQKKND